MARNAWNSSVNKPFHARTTNLPGSIKRWCKKKKPIQQQLDTIQDQINAIQIKPIHKYDHSMEAALIRQYEETMSKLTEYYRQRAKKHRAAKGDRNTPYFQNAVLKRRRSNRIVSIADAHGNYLSDPNDIAAEFVNYFRNIFCSNRSNNDRELPSTTLPHESHDFTNSIPSKQEIWETLKSMKRNASPGPDGFNVAFYLVAWNWMGDDVTALISNFYLTAILPVHLNDTHITLIPKKNWLVMFLLIIGQSACVM